jgi:arylsulfatase A-like enzyme
MHHRVSKRKAGAWLGLLAWLLVGCVRETVPPNLLLISLDTTRGDHLSVYGYERRTTPNLEFFATEGVLFREAYAPAPTTGPSHATMFTSLAPITHRVVKNGRQLKPSFETLAERFGAAGWETAGFVSSYVLDARFGWDQGFGHWDDEFEPSTATAMVPAEGGAEAFDRRATETTRRTLSWVEHDWRRDQPFFVFVHYMDPHDPWVAPRQFVKRLRTPDLPADGISGMKARYDAEIAFVDHQVGVLVRNLDKLGFGENTLVAVVADHGEGLLDHGELHHGTQLYEEQMRVPLLLRWPLGLPAGRVVDGAVSLVDLAPTLLDLAGVSTEAGAPMQGRSLLPRIHGQEPDAAEPVFLFRPDNTEIPGEQYAIREGDWKLIVGPGEDARELFDLSQDPEERNDLSAAEPAKVAALDQKIRDWLETHRRGDTVPDDVSQDDLERLRALGYVP